MKGTVDWKSEHLRLFSLNQIRMTQSENYRLNIGNASCANCQRAALAAIARATSAHVLSCELKTRLFLSFRMVQATSVAMVSKPHLLVCATFKRELQNQRQKDSSLTGRHHGNPILKRTAHHSW